MHHFPILQQYIDIEAMCKTLHNKYPEYNRKKFRVFKQQVETAFQKLLSGGPSTSREMQDTNLLMFKDVSFLIFSALECQKKT